MEVDEKSDRPGSETSTPNEKHDFRDDTHIEDPEHVHNQSPLHDPALDAKLNRQFDLHILPWLFGMWLLAFIDRANIGMYITKGRTKSRVHRDAVDEGSARLVDAVLTPSQVTPKSMVWLTTCSSRARSSTLPLLFSMCLTSVSMCRVTSC